MNFSFLFIFLSKFFLNYYLSFYQQSLKVLLDGSRRYESGSGTANADPHITYLIGDIISQISAKNPIKSQLC